jgi:hypothetical protein
MSAPATTEDREHLKLLAIFHWIVAAFVALFSLFPILHLIIGLNMVGGRWPHDAKLEQGPFPIEAFGWFFIVFACLWILCGIALAICLALSARYLTQYRRRTFCMIVAGVSCMFFPFGTALGVFTLVVLSRESVRALFVDPRPAALS